MKEERISRTGANVGYGYGRTLNLSFGAAVRRARESLKSASRRKCPKAAASSLGAPPRWRRNYRNSENSIGGRYRGRLLAFCVPAPAYEIFFPTPIKIGKRKSPGFWVIWFFGEFHLMVGWCRRGDSNPHEFPHHPLKMACLPVPPLRHSDGHSL